ncbi:uncharacterized protein N7469_005319 [Penicillium citrinum]|uniref:Zn(2)-C6 fungal-type domain-containing protein n=2 Tax=Penicillium TaxID=5073 RepID=A0A9W9P1B2_PENCI|nr:uncharacterized protein N7469_005319 [Penicillium citrinum]KAJ5233553.1 hypothetical protein N7469_005319 [Penicillium citrinum]KAJ5572977.1 hypothetical protein N7450_009961 [Penicillium hetheringtonii]
MAGSKKPRGIRHDRHCYRCRMKGIKCDLNRPRCQPCLQQDVPCQYPQRVKWMSEKTAPSPVLKSSPRVSPSSPSSNTTSSISTMVNNQYDRTNLHANIPVNLYGFIDLLSHFYQEIQSSKQELPDEAVELISRTLSFARSRLQGTDDKDSIQSHLTALSNLSRVIESAHPVALFGIGTFAMFEVCCGSFGQWHRHLQGARSLLDLHCHNQTDMNHLTRQIPGLADVLAYLVWFDVTGTLVREDGALIFNDWHRNCLHQTFFSSVGCPPDTFDLFVHLAKLDSESQSQSQSQSNTPESNIILVQLSTRAMNQILHLDSTDTTESGLAAAVYRYAGAIGAFARLNRPRHENRTDEYSHSSVLSDMVDRACGAISMLPTTSRFYVHLATPAYLIGQHATHAGQCEVIRTYWRNCRLCEFPRYPDGQEQCERHWVNRGIILGT